MAIETKTKFCEFFVLWTDYFTKHYWSLTLNHSHSIFTENKWTWIVLCNINAKRMVGKNVWKMTQIRNCCGAYFHIVWRLYPSLNQIFILSDMTLSLGDHVSNIMLTARETRSLHFFVPKGVMCTFSLLSVQTSPFLRWDRYVYIKSNRDSRSSISNKKYNTARHRKC